MTGQVAIEHCGRTTAATVVAFDIQWSGDLPADREVTWAVRVAGPYGDGRVELGHQRSGASRSQYALDLTSGRCQEVGVDADLLDREITVRFPAEVVGLAVEWPTWQAVVLVNGQEIATSGIQP